MLIVQLRHLKFKFSESDGLYPRSCDYHSAKEEQNILIDNNIKTTCNEEGWRHQRDEVDDR